MANECRIIDNKVGGDHRSSAENPMVHALSCQWPFGESKLDLKQSSLRRVRSNNLKLASWLATLVRPLEQAYQLKHVGGKSDERVRLIFVKTRKDSWWFLTGLVLYLQTYQVLKNPPHKHTNATPYGTLSLLIWNILQIFSLKPPGFFWTSNWHI